MIWIVSLSHCLARIYTYQPLDRLTEIECVENPAGHLKESDLLTDRPGRYQTSHTARSAYEWPSDPQEVELGRFTHYVADRLKKGLNEKSIYATYYLWDTPCEWCFACTIR
ncbi:host attachment protein [Rickettsiella massiliensis]|uniref:host attachment protein n=1 Tax=Rickettsiella massiliensis TaxID=676517 RepID=UPI000299E4DC|nr:host attachment protein [Rickettsiella massiliensis]